MRNSGTRNAGLVTIDVDDRSVQPLPQRYAEATFTAWVPDGSGIVLAARTFGMRGTGNDGQLWVQP